MIIQLNDTLRVFGTQRAWELQRFVPATPKTKEHWRSFKYYTSFQGALNAAAMIEIRTADVEGVSEALQAVEAIMAKYAKLFDREVKAASKLEAA